MRHGQFENHASSRVVVQSLQKGNDCGHVEGDVVTHHDVSHRNIGGDIRPRATELLVLHYFRRRLGIGAEHLLRMVDGGETLVGGPGWTPARRRNRRRGHFR